MASHESCVHGLPSSQSLGLVQQPSTFLQLCDSGSQTVQAPVHSASLRQQSGGGIADVMHVAVGFSTQALGWQTSVPVHVRHSQEPGGGVEQTPSVHVPVPLPIPLHASGFAHGVPSGRSSVKQPPFGSQSLWRHSTELPQDSFLQWLQWLTQWLPSSPSSHSSPCSMSTSPSPQSVHGARQPVVLGGLHHGSGVGGSNWGVNGGPP